jgi:hypothetical protein
MNCKEFEMGRTKKRKQEPLTQEEIWDDSALLRSWQEALDEYQVSHSNEVSIEV